MKYDMERAKKLQEQLGDYVKSITPKNNEHARYVYGRNVYRTHFEMNAAVNYLRDVFGYAIARFGRLSNEDKSRVRLLIIAMLLVGGMLLRNCFG